MANPTDKQLIQELKEAFANIDQEEAERITQSLPVFDITEMKPGDVVAIHFPVTAPRPKPQTNVPAE
jgi:DNA-directed RNA polymerase subunit H (RpoH/RPB5)